MARGKKKEELSLEENLEQALVPVEEQPYEVPENWFFFRFTSLIDIEGGTQPPKSQFVEEPMEGYVRLVQIRDFASEKYAVYVPDTKKLRKFSKDDVMIARYGASIGRICMGLEGAYNVALAKTIFPKETLNRDYVYWMLQSETFQNPLRTISRSAQAGFNKEDLSNFMMPLPPLKEQQRIVERIESLFAKLDEARDKVKEVISSIDDNVEAMLYKALTGQLTNKWRNLNAKKEKWNDTTLSDIVSGLKYGSSEKSDYEYQGTPILRIPNIGDGIVDFSDIKYMSGELENPSHEVFENDILIIRSNGSRDLVGKCAMVPELKQRYAYASFLIRMKASEKVLPEYLVRFMNSSMARVQMFAKAKSSSGIHNINSKELGAIKICVPSIEEQRQILAIIRKFVDKEKKAREMAEEVIDNIDRLKKSILSEAFRGKLGTNNPKEESSIELFKKILMEK